MTEIQIQAQSYVWFHNNFPSLRGLLCYNLNNSKNKIDGNQNKSLGLQKGRSDMVFYYRGSAYFFEFKTETGVQSKEQKEWEAKVTKQGFQYFIIRSVAEFQTELNKLLTL
jgi:hypothetical protein